MRWKENNLPQEIVERTGGTLKEIEEKGYSAGKIGPVRGKRIPSLIEKWVKKKGPFSKSAEGRDQGGGLGTKKTLDLGLG